MNGCHQCQLNKRRKESWGVIHRAWLWMSLTLAPPPMTWVSTAQPLGQENPLQPRPEKKQFVNNEHYYLLS